MARPLPPLFFNLPFLAHLMQSVTYQVDGGISASRRTAIIRPIIILPVLALLSLYKLIQLIVWPFSVLLLLIRRERAIADLLRAQSYVSLCSNWAAFFLLLSDQWPPNAVRVRLAYSPLVSRFELLFRPFFTILLGVNAVIFGIPAFVVLVMQWLYILWHGRRHPRLHKLLLIYFTFILHVNAYFWLGVDERPKLFPAGIANALKQHSHLHH